MASGPAVAGDPQRQVPAAAQVKVAITPIALEALGRHVRAGGNGVETGGILLGHETPTAYHILVAGGPGPGAVRTPTSFNRDLAHAENLAEQAWQQHRAVWLGEWHTHVHVPPLPSETDLSSYLRHLDDVDLGFDHFISIIVGPVGTPDGSSFSASNPPVIGLPGAARRRGCVAPSLMTWIIQGLGAYLVPLQIGDLND